MDYLRLALTLLLLLPGALRADGAAMVERLQLDQAAGKLEGLHGVLVLVNGAVFAEVYFPGNDERWGEPLGFRNHGPEVLHDLRSVTKSIVALLYGIALDDGLVPPPNAPLFAQFPEYPNLASDPDRSAITVGHALSMSMGLHWDESRPYTDPANSEIAMERAPDRYRFVLEQPVVGPPGQTWRYSGGATALLARLIEKGSTKPLDEFAQSRLFAPLGITRFEWIEGADGAPSAASGLRLSARSLARIGQMVLNRGEAGGRRVVSDAWLEALFTPQLDLGELRYGYHWYLAPGTPPRWMAGFGNGGQRLSVNPSLNIVLVVQGGRYNRRDDWRLGVTVSTDYLAPALRAAGVLP